MVGVPYNSNNCAFVTNQALNVDQFNGNVPYSSNNTNHLVLWDFVDMKLLWVNSKTNIIEAEIGGGGGLQIPRPEINIGKATVETGYGSAQPIFAHYLPPIDSSFLNFNPKYYLFMQKSNANKKKNINGEIVKTRRSAGIYHPTHLNGINFPGGAFYSGVTDIPLHTEFDIAPTPYTRTQIGINPFEWARYASGTTWVVPTIADFGGLLDDYKIQGKKKSSSRSALMFLCIGIENPNTTSNYPITFGPLSIPFKLALKKQGLPALCIGLQFLMESSSVHITQ
jgi:hypothetical protein